MTQSTLLAELEKEISPEDLNRSPTRREMIQTVEALDIAVRGALDRFNERIKQLESTQLKFCGTWSENERRDPRSKIGSFGIGALLVDKGGLWHARRITSKRPGQDDSWQLITKRGDFDR